MGAFFGVSCAAYYAWIQRKNDADPAAERLALVQEAYETSTNSISRRANSSDNAPMENFFSHFKEEVWRHQKRSTFQQTQQIVDEYIHFYNYERIQCKTEQTPYETRSQFYA